jgi:hypothetical protein
LKLLKTSIALAALVSTLAATHVQAASFDARSQGAPAKKYSQSQARGAINKFKAAGGGGGVQATEYYCVWTDANGNVHYQSVNMLTICVNSIKVACHDNGSCTLE